MTWQLPFVFRCGIGVHWGHLPALSVSCAMNDEALVILNFFYYFDVFLNKILYFWAWLAKFSGDAHIS